MNATLRAQPGTDASYRWLMGEDAHRRFSGALRDMWNPTCYSNPGKVTDTAYYVCSTADGGGVHTNSGVPNHGFALLVDGGTYNGQTIAPIGLTKAAHIYFRAQAVYQVEDSDFADHADALEASCARPRRAAARRAHRRAVRRDHRRVRLRPGGDDDRGGRAADAARLLQLRAAAEPGPAGALQRHHHDRRRASRSRRSTSRATRAASWTASRTAASPDFTPRDWTWVHALPSGRAGSGFFAPDPNIGTCAPGGDESGVLHLTSPAITLPADDRLRAGDVRALGRDRGRASTAAT